LNANSFSPPVEAIKPWTSKTGPLISFLCDDGALYQSQFHHLSTVSPTPERLEIHAPPHGYTVITGPVVRELCAALESQRATMIRTDGIALTSVIRLSEKEHAVHQIEVAGQSAHPDPDLDLGEVD
jgi:hypothetical protein